MAQANKTCQKCGELGHSKFYCKNTPAKPIPKVSAKKLAQVATEPKKKKKAPKTDRAKAKENAVTAFQYYIRIRDSINTTGTTDHCVCVTCRERGFSEPKEFKHIQAGHGVGGRGNAVLFDERVTNGQCDYCNLKPPRGLGGDYGNYAIYFVKTYGLEEAQEIQRLRHQTKVYKLHDFIRIEQEYKTKVKELLE